MSDILNKIVEITISASNQTIVDKNFNSILILGNTKDDESNIIAYSSLANIATGGYNANTPEYKIAQQIFAQSPRIKEVLIAQVVDGETFEVAVQNILASADNDRFYALVITSEDHDDILAISEIIETEKKIFGVSTSEEDVKNGVGNNLLALLSAQDSQRTFMFYNEGAFAPAAALLGKMFTFDAGSATWIYKNLNGVPVNQLTPTERDYLEEHNCFYYSSMGNVGVTLLNGKSIGGSYLDIVHGLDRFESLMQTNIANLLITTPKIPYTPAGLLLVESAINKSLKFAVDQGILSDYVIEMPVFADISTADKNERILTNCKFSGTLQGAIHKITIAGTVTV